MQTLKKYDALAALLDDRCEVEHRLAIAVRNALIDHKQAGNTVAIWQHSAA